MASNNNDSGNVSLDIYSPLSITKMKTLISPSYNLLPQEWKDLRRGVLKYFVLPSLIVYCTATSAMFSVDGFSWNDFLPGQMVMGTIFGTLFAQIISFSTKYMQQNVVVVKTNEAEVLDTTLDSGPTVVDMSLLPKG